MKTLVNFTIIIKPNNLMKAFAILVSVQMDFFDASGVLKSSMACLHRSDYGYWNLMTPASENTFQIWP
jgi:hypothetical protein